MTETIALITGGDSGRGPGAERTHTSPDRRWYFRPPRAQAILERIIRDGHSAAEVVRRIRALFKEATPVKALKASGIGMGLSICRSIVEAHGGRIWATANEEAGMTFSFTLPLTSDGPA